MKTVKYKVSDTGHRTLQHPAAPIGWNNPHCFTRAITGCPDEATTQEILALDDRTMYPTDCFEVAYADLPGNLYRNPKYNKHHARTKA